MCGKDEPHDLRIAGEKIGRTMRSLNLALGKCIGVATDGCSV